MSNEELYEAALDAARELFGDTSVGKAEAKRNLSTLVGEIEIMIESIGDDDIDD